jgi:hypothetical protein
MKPRHLVGGLVFVIALASALALAASVRADVGTVSFAGSGIGGQEITGTFTLDHFTVKTPLANPALVNPPVPQLVAVGTVTGESTFFSVGGLITVPFEDAPFVWVKLAAAASCGDSATVTFGDILGSDYVDLHSQPLWDPGVPPPVWNASVHWGVTVTSTPLVLSGNGGLACTIAQAVSRGDVLVEARTLNSLLRQQ